MNITLTNILISVLSMLFVVFSLIFVIFGKKMDTNQLSRRININKEKEKSLANKILEEEASQNFFDKLQTQLNRAKIDMNAYTYFLFTVICSIICGCIVTFLIGVPFFGIVICVIVIFVSKGYLKSKREKYEKEFEMEMVKALKRMSSSIRVGSSMENAIKDVVDSENIPQIVKNEFKKIYLSVKAGFSINESFYELYKSVGTDKVLYLCIAVDTQLETGGDKADIFSSIAQDITDKNIKDMNAKSKLAETTLTIKFLAAIPFFLAIVIGNMSSEIMDFYTSDIVGQIIFALIFTWVIVGYYFMKKMSKVD